MVDQLLELVRGFQVQPVALLDIALTALLIYGLFSLIRGTRAVRLVIGVTVLYAIYVLAQAFGLQLLSQILQAGAVVGLLAIVVVFQPELRRALERIGRVGSLSWLLAPGAHSQVERVARLTAQAAFGLGAKRIGALVVLERDTGLQDAAETGVMVDAELSLELLETIFTPHSALHDGAVIIRHERLVSAGTVLPLSETGAHRERFGTRHRAALGITEQTDAVVVAVSEETGVITLFERGRILRMGDEKQLREALIALLERNPLSASAARFPARATDAMRRQIEPIGTRVRARRQRAERPAPSAHSGSTASATPATPPPAAASSAGAGSGRVE